MNHQKILFIGGGVSRQNGAEDFTIKTVIAMSRALLMQAALIFTQDTLSTDIWTMEMDYDVWINSIPDNKYGLSSIQIWPMLRFDPVLETLINCHV